ncbi:hypothetical protein WOLCODRAFT_19926 [Wolfiporia cocos MD-104 SS10]|uniref:Uncharacterized protein n=1 Tax=Wolfiporia cocos (strain MD-104) TaxID=742152 RepID=A0A2H3J0W9_WOLCO|nr:hypothetical protein WOLCODRAFT_19926 [Wolfiporia cocos MD-104 SS10]
MSYPPESTLIVYSFVVVRSLFGGATAATFICLLRLLDTVIECLNITALWGYATEQFARNSSWYCTAIFNSSVSREGFYECYPLTQQAEEFLTNPPDARMAAESHSSAPVLSSALFSGAGLVIQVELVMSRLQLGLGFPGTQRPINGPPSNEYLGMILFGIHTGFSAIVDIIITVLLWINLRHGSFKSVAQIAQIIIFYENSSAWLAVQLIGSKSLPPFHGWNANYYYKTHIRVNARNYIKRAGVNADGIQLANLG